MIRARAALLLSILQALSGCATFARRAEQNADAADAGAAFLLGDRLDATGRPEEALESYVETLELAGRSGGEDEAEAVAAAMALVALRSRVRDPAGRLEGLADRLAAKGARLPPEAWVQLRNLSFACESLAARPEVPREALRATGCLTRFDVEGPLGPRTWEAFDGDPGAPAAPWGVDRDRVDAPTCRVRAHPAARSEPGTFRARTAVVLERPGEVAFRLETGAAARVRIGAAVVHESDTRAAWLPPVRWFRATLPAGTVPVAVELASPSSPPVFSLAAFAADGRPAFSACDPALRATILSVPPPAAARAVPVSEDPAASRGLALLRAALWHEDHQRAGEILDCAGSPSPLLLAARAELARGDPSLPAEEGFETAERLLGEALEGEPLLWQARSHLARQWTAEGRGQEAMALLAEGTALSPDEPGLWDRLAGIAAELDWPAELAAAVEALERLRPGERETLAWRLLLARRSEAAPAALEVARRVSDLEELRIDGPALVAHYRRTAPAYDTAAVRVLERAVHLVDRDGSRTELVHTIAHLRTAEAVEDHGEVGVPAGARLLAARTIKADGRVLEPEQDDRKETVSLPDLEPGDFAECEYVYREPPSSLFPGGFDTGRFFFRDFATAFHRSEMILVVPAGMEFTLDPRGAPPASVERGAGDLRVLTWRVRGNLPLAPEPLSPPMEEHLPSIRVVAGDSPGALAARLRELLAGGGRRDPRLERLARDIAGGISPEDRDARYRAVHRWILENIEESGDLFEPPGHIAARRSGSRDGVLLGLLAALGLEARLALVLPAGGDETPGAATSATLADRRAILLPGSGWVSLEQAGAPFGWLPPDLRNRPAVFVDDGDAARTDGGIFPVDAQRVDIDLALRADGTATGRVVEHLEGVLAVGWRADLRRLGPEQRAELFQEEYVSETVPGARLTSLDVRGLDDPEADLVLEWSFEAPGFARPVHGGLAGELPFAITLLRRLGGLASRTTPVVVAEHIEKTVRATVAPPAGFAFEVAPAPDAASEWGSVTRHVSAEGGRLVVEIDAALDADRIPPERYPALLEFARAADLASRVVLAVRPGP